MRIRAYAGAVAAVVAASIVTFAINGILGPSVSLLFFPAIILTAIFGGYGPSLVATVLATASLAYFFVPPVLSLDIGLDDALRLVVFAMVAVGTAALSAARRRAEDALRTTVVTLRRVVDWPAMPEVSVTDGAQRVTEHAAAVASSAAVVAVWEVGDEPWWYVSDSRGNAASRRPPGAHTLDASGATVLDDPTPDGERSSISAGFAMEQVRGRAYFLEMREGPSDSRLLAQLVAREIGSTLEQLHVHDQARQLALREDRLRVARDLHDGVLQSLTAVRFQLQALADAPRADIVDHLLAIERAIALEQRELRDFIDALRPAGARRPARRNVAESLGVLCERLAAEWRTTINTEVNPVDLEVPAALEEPVRLMVREAAVNALKHARPSRVTVNVQARPDGSLHVAVSDDGTGFPFRGRRDHAELVATGTAPTTLRERTESLGGRLSIDSTDHGSTVDITVPAVVGA